MMERNSIYCGDWKEAARQLKPGSIDCIITSPPYYGLRDYGTGKWEGGRQDCDHLGDTLQSNKSTLGGRLPEETINDKRTRSGMPFKSICGKCGAVRIDQQLGIEETPEQYISNLVEGFRLLRVALKDCGTLWVNIGDSYWGGKGQSGQGLTPEQQERRSENGESLNKSFHQIAGPGKTRPTDKKSDIYKPKDLIGIPWMLAFALRSDGWYLRQDIIWNKPNPMPESVTDRCTKSHEYIFLFSKSKNYYFDAEAIKEDVVAYEIERRKKEKAKGFGGKRNLKTNGHETGQAPQSENGAVRDLSKLINLTLTGKRNKRSVWTVTTKPFKDAHFACYPHELIDPCIMAGTSEKGCCPKCGDPWVRILETKNIKRNEFPPEDPRYRPNQYVGNYEDINGKGDAGYTETKTIGWAPSCNCGISETVPAIVYDPFMGSGTTGSAAKSLGRDYMGSELNPEYLKIQSRRLHKELGLFNQK